MKWISYISILFIIYIVCSSGGCTENEDVTAKKEEQYIMNLKDSVISVFMSDTLSDPLLKSFEITAIQKLNDFTDYLKIISDTTLEVQFRQQAAELIRALFVPGEIKLQNWSNIYPEPGLYTLELLLAHSLSEGISCWIKPLGINIDNPFTRENDSTFTGTLSFYHNRFLFGNQEPSEVGSRKLIINVYIIRKVKSFGDEQLRVWEVCLGDIK